MKIDLMYDTTGRLQLMLPVEDMLTKQEDDQSVKQELEELRKQYPDLFVQVFKSNKNILHLAAESGHEK